VVEGKKTLADSKKRKKKAKKGGKGEKD